MRFPRWLRSPFGWTAALAVLLLAAPLARFSAWRADRWEESARASRMLETALGPVEFLAEGEGAPVLVLHGSPGGCDLAMALAAPLIDAGFEVVAPSRPGYLRTPLASGVLVTQQAELMADLMTRRGAEKFSVLAFGQGAPVALALAEKAPDRVRSIALLSPILRSRSWNEILKENRLPGWTINQAFTGDMGAWLFAEQARWQPARALERAFSLTTTLKPFDQFSEAQELAAQKENIETFRSLVKGMTPVSRREAGIRNDTTLSLFYPEWNFARLSMPALIVQGAADAFSDGKETGELLSGAPNARRIELARTGHLVQLGPESAEAMKQVIEFFRSAP